MLDPPNGLSCPPLPFPYIVSASARSSSESSFLHFVLKKYPTIPLSTTTPTSAPATIPTTVPADGPDESLLALVLFASPLANDPNAFEVKAADAVTNEVTSPRVVGVVSVSSSSVTVTTGGTVTVGVVNITVLDIEVVNNGVEVDGVNNGVLEVVGVGGIRVDVDVTTLRVVEVDTVGGVTVGVDTETDTTGGGDVLDDGEGDDGDDAELSDGDVAAGNKAMVSDVCPLQVYDILPTLSLHPMLHSSVDDIAAMSSTVLMPVMISHRCSCLTCVCQSSTRGMACKVVSLRVSLLSLRRLSCKHCLHSLEHGPLPVVAEWIARASFERSPCTSPFCHTPPPINAFSSLACSCSHIPR